MKTLTLIAIYIASFMIIFLIVSLPAYLFVGSYSAVIKCLEWQIIYSAFIGWWLAIFPAREYYAKHEKEFDKIF